MFLLRSSDVEQTIATYGLDRFMDRMISEIEAGFRSFDIRTAQIPARSGFVGDGLIEMMPVSLVDQSVVIKVVGYFPENPSRNNTSTIQAYIGRSEWKSGALTDLVEGSLLTALRTGAASAVASRILARPDSKTLGLVGCGAQSITQAHAISRCFNIERILAYDTCAITNASLSARLAFLGLPVYPAALEEVEAEADILCTATSVEVGVGPVVRGNRLKPHVHINAVGSDFPGKVELPVSVLRKAVVVPDHHQQAIREGECQQLDLASIGPELHSLVRNKVAYAHLQRRVTVFDSTGVALEDAIALDLTCRLAREADIGQTIAFAGNLSDPKSPYARCLSLASATAEIVG